MYCVRPSTGRKTEKFGVSFEAGLFAITTAFHRATLVEILRNSILSKKRTTQNEQDEGKTDGSFPSRPPVPSITDTPSSPGSLCLSVMNAFQVLDAEARIFLYENFLSDGEQTDSSSP